MGNSHFYLLSSLKGLVEFGSPPPIGKSAFIAKVGACRGPKAAVEALLLGDDLLQREAVLSGEIEAEEADLAVLSASEVTGVEAWPSVLPSDGSSAGKERPYAAAVDGIWEAYFHHVARIANALNSRFLGEWVTHEVGLRNAMVRIRAEVLGLDAGPYLVAKDLGSPMSHFHKELDAWKRASDPLEALESLERSRWQRLTEQEPWYAFCDDEVVAYGAKLLVLIRWHRITQGNPVGSRETV